MTLGSRTLTTGAWFAVLVAGTAGCLCPCPNGVVAAAPATAGGATNAPPAMAGAPGTPVANGARLVLWDGDGAGNGAQGWDACADPKTGCSKVASVPGVGTSGSTGIKLHGEGPGWLGMGWNLFGWYPENAGVDMTPYTHLTFQIRVEAKSPAEAPDPGSAGVLLGCSHNKKDSATVLIERYAKGFEDGKWHRVEIPIVMFTKGPGAGFDPQSFWEFRVSTWSGSPRKFDIYVDDLSLEKH